MPRYSTLLLLLSLVFALACGLGWWFTQRELATARKDLALVEAELRLVRQKLEVEQILSRRQLELLRQAEPARP